VSTGGHTTRLVTTAAEVREAVRSARAQGRSIGLVPTMGALHAGHAALVECCRIATDFVAVSVFVNPTQFGPAEDYQRYPRSLDADVELCRSAGADLVFAPAAEEVYPRGREGLTYVEVPGISEPMEGASRPGHFRGVATVVLKLFGIVGPDRAFFGAKDYQQLAVIRRMAADLDLPLTISGVETVREPDGLAMSSRNRYLDADGRRAALSLSKGLKAAQAAVHAGERDADRVRQILAGPIESEPGADLIYAVVADAENLQPLAEIDPDRPAVALVAARVGATRLIDNLVLNDRLNSVRRIPDSLG